MECWTVNQNPSSSQAVLWYYYNVFCDGMAGKASFREIGLFGLDLVAWGKPLHKMTACSWRHPNFLIIFFFLPDSISLLPFRSLKFIPLTRLIKADSSFHISELTGENTALVVREKSENTSSEFWILKLTWSKIDIGFRNKRKAFGIINWWLCFIMNLSGLWKLHCKFIKIKKSMSFH